MVPLITGTQWVLYVKEEKMINAKKLSKLGKMYKLNGTIYTGEAYHLDSNGKLLAHFFLNKGQYTKLFTSYYPSGIVSAIYPYRAGLIHGTVYLYDKEGAIKELTSYFFNRKEGPCLEFRRGKVCEISSYVNNRLSSLDQIATSTQLPSIYKVLIDGTVDKNFLKPKEFREILKKIENDRI